MPLFPGSLTCLLRCKGHLPLNLQDTDQRGWCREALDSQAMTDAVEGWEWELPDTFLGVSVKWVCRTEPSKQLAALCSEYSFEGWEGQGVGLLCVWWGLSTLLAVCSHTGEREGSDLLFLCGHWIHGKWPISMMHLNLSQSLTSKCPLLNWGVWKRASTCESGETHLQCWRTTWGLYISQMVKKWGRTLLWLWSLTSMWHKAVLR